MDNQEDNIIIRGKRTKAQNIRDGNYTAVKKRPENRHSKKIEEETENFEHQKVSHNMAQTIQQARVGKGLTRKELAERLNVKVAVITEYETGKAIPNNMLLQKLSRVLGVTLRKNM